MGSLERAFCRMQGNGALHDAAIRSRLDRDYGMRFQAGGKDYVCTESEWL
jgi:hypothetical protein